MNHQSVKKLLSPYIDRELDAGTDKSVRDHVEGCTSCQEHIRALRQVKTAIMDAATIQMPDNFYFSVRRALNREEQETLVWLSTERFARNLVTALLLVVFGVIAYGSITQPNPLIGIDRYFTGEVSDSAAHAVLGSQQEISKDDVILAAISR